MLAMNIRQDVLYWNALILLVNTSSWYVNRVREPRSTRKYELSTGDPFKMSSSRLVITSSRGRELYLHVEKW